MTEALIAVWRVCTFSAGPDRVPFNVAFLLIVVAVSVALSVKVTPSQFTIEDIVIAFTSVQVAVASLLVVGIQGAVLMFFLRLKNKAGRLPQTLVAWFGTTAIIDTISTLAIYIFGQLGFLLFAVFLVWFISVKAYILQRAFDSTFVMGALSSIGVMLVALIGAAFYLNLVVVV